MNFQPPTGEDIDEIAGHLAHAQELVALAGDAALDRSENDLSLLQAVLDGGRVEREAAYSLEALGFAFGAVLVRSRAGYDWWIVEDEEGRDPCLRYKASSLQIFPQSMIVSRVEDGQTVDVVSLYAGLVKRLAELEAEVDASSA